MAAPGVGREGPAARTSPSAPKPGRGPPRSRSEAARPRLRPETGATLVASPREPPPGEDRRAGAGVAHPRPPTSEVTSRQREDNQGRAVRVVTRPLRPQLGEVVGHQRAQPRGDGDVLLAAGAVSDDAAPVSRPVV